MEIREAGGEEFALRHSGALSAFAVDDDRSIAIATEFGEPCADFRMGDLVYVHEFLQLDKFHLHSL